MITSDHICAKKHIVEVSLICPNYLGEIRSHQESGHLTMSPKISPRVQTSHQESNRLTKCDAMLVRFNLTKSLTNMGVPFWFLGCFCGTFCACVGSGGGSGDDESGSSGAVVGVLMVEETTITVET